MVNQRCMCNSLATTSSYTRSTLLKYEVGATSLDVGCSVGVESNSRVGSITKREGTAEMAAVCSILEFVAGVEPAVVRGSGFVGVEFAR